MRQRGQMVLVLQKMCWLIPRGFFEPRSVDVRNGWESQLFGRTGQEYAPAIAGANRPSSGICLASDCDAKRETGYASG